MTVLIPFFIVLAILTALFVVVILLAGFRPQRGSRAARSRSGGPGGAGDGSGGTTPQDRSWVGLPPMVRRRRVQRVANVAHAARLVS